MNQPLSDDYLLFPEIKDRGKAGRLLDVAMVNLMKQAKSPSELIYAYLKCGFIVTKGNKGKFTKNELKEWGKGKHPLLTDVTQ